MVEWTLFRFAKHPKIAPKIVEMKSEIVAYNHNGRLVKDVKPAARRPSTVARDLRWRRSFHGSYGVGAAAGTARPYGGVERIG